MEIKGRKPILCGLETIDTTEREINDTVYAFYYRPSFPYTPKFPIKDHCIQLTYFSFHVTGSNHRKSIFVIPEYCHTQDNTTLRVTQENFVTEKLNNVMPIVS